MGPLKMMDLFALDLIWQTISSGAVPGMGDPRLALMKELVDVGHFGVKSGRGFYDYCPRSPDEVMREVNEGLLLALKGTFKETQGG
jgi:3-hydroxybutyryl-CoA dehydrogenase